jgi:hypothetical protein
VFVGGSNRQAKKKTKKSPNPSVGNSTMVSRRPPVSTLSCVSWAALRPADLTPFFGGKSSRVSFRSKFRVVSWSIEKCEFSGRRDAEREFSDSHFLFWFGSELFKYFSVCCTGFYAQSSKRSASYFPPTEEFSFSRNRGKISQNIRLVV